MLEKPEVHHELFAEDVTHFVQVKQEIRIYTTKDVILSIQVITPSIFRLRYATDGYFEDDFSYAIDPDFKPKVCLVDLQESDLDITIESDELICKVRKSDLHVSFLDHDGVVLNEDEKGFHWEIHPQFGGNIVKMSKVVQDREAYFGLGDKSSIMNLRGKRFQNWGTDEYGFSKGRDPLYKNIPFYIGLHHKKSYGIFLDNSFRTFFDFASERRNATSFWAAGGEMNYYFVGGPLALDVVSRYTQLTGTPQMPPLWALGYHQSKWSYAPDSEVLEIARKFREVEIPCDGIHLDIDYMDGFRCFTWDPKKFTDPGDMVRRLKVMGMKTVVIIDPGIKIDHRYPVFREAFEKEYFCKRADGPLMKGKVWPGECHFPDYTNPVVRDWWAGLFKELVGEIGVSGIWNDMNEPAVFELPDKTFPNDVRHDYDGHPCSHRRAHNVYGMQMARASYSGVRQFGYPNRPFIITRSAYAGAQRFTSTWTGDSVATWEHLWVANVQCQRMSLSGMSFVGSDIGGFTEHPSSELYIRWMQLGVFHPLCRTHSSGDHGDQEPWSFGETALGIVRKFIQLRYRMLPYFYTVFYQYAERGTPMLRPLFIYDQEDSDTHYRIDEFVLGDHLLVCPILEPNVQGRYLYLPDGSWYNFWTDEVVSGGTEIWVDAPLDKIPLFVREGAILPNYPLMQHVDVKKIERLILHVYLSDGEHISEVYEDAGDGYDYRHGKYLSRSLELVVGQKFIHLKQRCNGEFQPVYSDCTIIWHGPGIQNTIAEVDNGTAPVIMTTFEEKEVFKMEVPSNFRIIRIDRTLNEITD